MRAARPWDTAGVRASLAVTTALALAACADDEPAGDPLDDFVLTSPDGFVELIPTSTVELAWDVTARPPLSLELDLDLVGSVEPALVIHHAQLAPGSFTWDGLDTRNQPALPGNYQVRAIAVEPSFGTVDARPGDNAHLVVVQGVRFRDGELSFTGAQSSRELALTTVNRSVMAMTLALDPDPAVEGDELPLLTANVPGELVPFARTYPFTGRTAADAPVPGGRYQLVALIAAEDGARHYRVAGPGLSWAP